jgi:hypothetical protein|tara:strand:- start:3480 stop:5378 length:1899 start_codon:yes stop_codon:yes gene_type:complete
MKTGVLTTKTIASEGMTSSVMGMSVKGMDIASYFLRDRIYTDKMLAVIRELISNADDEHNKHKIKKSVEVKLSLVDDQWIWKVRDHALGLSDHGIRNIFGMYFESTKGHDNESIGGFGVGSKSPLCYTDSFFITSHHDGVKTSYCSSLGAGKNGIPVGEIFEISKEPTTEQGIEISLDVTNDVGEFSRKCKRFVNSLCPNTNIVFHDEHKNSVDIPLIPEESKTIGDYTVNRYINLLDRFAAPRCLIRMGGIIYNRDYSIPGMPNMKADIVIDVPIGKLTVPISRESIESTPANVKIFTEINEMMKTLWVDERSAIVVPKFGDFITGHLDASDYTGDWFTYRFAECFPDTQRMKNVVNRHPYTAPLHKPANNGKHIIYIFPNIKNWNNWWKRLDASLRHIDPTDYRGFVWIREDRLTEFKDGTDTLDVSDCVFADVKKLKLPKLAKDCVDVKYLAYAKYGYKHHVTSDELEAEVIQNTFAGVEQDDDWHKTATMIQLQARTVGYVKEYGTRSNWWNVSSKKLLEGLVELGWLTPDCPEYNARTREIRIANDLQRASDNAESTAKREFFNVIYNPRTIQALKNVPTKVDRIKNLREKLTKEVSTRGRILNSMKESYGVSHITRSDLRVILRLK